MMIFRDTKLGIYLAAARLAKETGEEKIVWLQRLAAVVTGEEPGPDLVDYFDLRRSEGQAWEALNLLAKRQFNHEAQDLERKLSTVLLDCEQLIAWLKSQHGISAVIQSHVKEWLTLAQAAKYLADIVKEKTEEIDILQLGLAKRLRLSVLFADYVKVKPGDGFNSKDRITALTGLCDLVMNSAGDNFVKSLICGGRKDKLQSGAVVEYRGAKYTLYQFLTPPDWTAQDQLEWEISRLGPEPQKDPRFYFPGPLPADCLIVVRPEALDDCAAALADLSAPPAAEPRLPVKASTVLSLEARLGEIVRRLFWSAPPPEGHNRPTKDLIVDWLLTGYGKDGLTEKAAGRIYQASKPDTVPSGNLPQTKKPFPPPPYPAE